MPLVFRNIDNFQICEYDYIDGIAIIIHSKGRFYTKQLFPYFGSETKKFLMLEMYNGHFQFRNKIYHNDEYPVVNNGRLPDWFLKWCNKTNAKISVKLNSIEEYEFKYFKGLKENFLREIRVI